MGRTADTLSILTDAVADGDTRTYTVKRVSVLYVAGTASPSKSASVACTATALTFDASGRFVRDARGEIISVDRVHFFMPTATVEVGDRLIRAGSTDYDEVLSVMRFSDHIEVLSREVEGR